MEDALISAEGLMILAGAGLLEATEDKTMKVHATETTDAVTVKATGVYGEEDYAVESVEITLDSEPYDDQGGDYVYVFLLKDGLPSTEPYIPATIEGNKITLKTSDDIDKFYDGCAVLVDYYVEKSTGVQQIEITPDAFGGNYYLEASTLFRTQSGVDVPAEFIIPNCRVQNNFSFNLAATGDPSTFSFAMDAFPDYTRFDHTKKVLCAIQMVETAGTAEISRDRTDSQQHDWFM